MLSASVCPSGKPTSTKVPAWISVFDRTARQECDAMAFEGHHLQTLGHVGLVDPVQVHRHTRLLQNPVGHTAPNRPQGRNPDKAMAVRHGPGKLNSARHRGVLWT